MVWLNGCGCLQRSSGFLCMKCRLWRPAVSFWWEDYQLCCGMEWISVVTVKNCVAGWWVNKSASMWHSVISLLSVRRTNDDGVIALFVWHVMSLLVVLRPTYKRWWSDCVVCLTCDVSIGCYSCYVPLRAFCPHVHNEDYKYCTQFILHWSPKCHLFIYWISQAKLKLILTIFSVWNLRKFLVRKLQICPFHL